MYIINDMAYAGDPIPTLRVKSVRPLEEYKLFLRFSNDEVRIFDFTPLLEGKCFAPLKDKAVFDRVYIEYGTVVWNDGEIDIAPEKLYEDGVVVDL